MSMALIEGLDYFLYWATLIASAPRIKTPYLKNIKILIIYGK